MADDGDTSPPPELASLTILWGDAEGEAPVRSRKLERPLYCPHKSVLLNHEARRVTCDACREEVDAFTVLANLANAWERYEGWAERHKTDAKRAGEELEEVKRQLRNVKAQLRRGARKAAPIVPNSVEDIVLRWMSAWRSSARMSPEEIGRHVRWLLTATPRDQVEPGDWRSLGKNEMARERGEAEVHELRPET